MGAGKLKKLLMISLYVLLMGVFLGCAGQQFKRGWGFVSQEFHEMDRVIEAARQGGKDSECPEQFEEVMDMRENVYDLYKQCNSSEARMKARETTQLANSLCPQIQSLPAPPPPPSTMPSPPPPEKVIEKMSLHLHYYFDKSIIKEQDYGQLNEALDFINKYPNAKVVLEGHTDNRGPEEYNHKLSHQRADSVKNYFIRRGGIDPSRIKTIGYGESRPLKSNDTPWGRYWNRRVDMLIVSDF